MPRFWLLKCEPDVYSIDDLARDRRTDWDGVRNYQVRNFMRDEMQPGDLGIFYHSNASPSGAAGVLRIERTGVADPTQFDPKSEYHDPGSRREQPTWLMCEVSFVERFARVVALDELRSHPALADMLILRRGNRLSITPLAEGEFEAIRTLGRSGGGPAGSPRTGAAEAKAAGKRGGVGAELKRGGQAAGVRRGGPRAGGSRRGSAR